MGKHGSTSNEASGPVGLGWWLASDGRWYPTAAVARSRSDRNPTMVVTAIAVTVALAVVLFASVISYVAVVPRASSALSPAGVQALDGDGVPVETGMSFALEQHVASSIVLVSTVACDKRWVGTGFAIADDFVATAAHVVAGASATKLERDDGTTVEAEVVGFDAGTDLAVLYAPGLDRPALALRQPERGVGGALFGHPKGQALRIRPFQVTAPFEGSIPDLYERRHQRVQQVELAVTAEHGDSGGPLVDVDGNVVGVLTKTSRTDRAQGWAVSSAELASRFGQLSARPVDTGPCVDIS